MSRIVGFCLTQLAPLDLFSLKFVKIGLADFGTKQIVY